jgi:hypothetical protein
VKLDHCCSLLESFFLGTAVEKFLKRITTFCFLMIKFDSINLHFHGGKINNLKTVSSCDCRVHQSSIICVDFFRDYHCSGFCLIGNDDEKERDREIASRLAVILYGTGVPLYKSQNRFFKF